ncbi:zinc-finger of the MIZ type in Nse subunit-domain-containing protein [Vararia minispora EC-137]|uniref:Zinc-finger of the MIZ type in Nse subunit-domain-containing protein n=1 Tax=Vararia minispora EC-137 TaxID=1314806 RepID=A0ACB8QC18_9AGAM|nr:zinc-finger of the MIZ type in Nse subunit-domain-containing protein [Vararia minispora EC-137]
MPVSRRRRAALVDDVEDADPTQQAEQDDVDMEEEEPQPRRAKGKGKAPMTNGHSRAAQRQENGAGGDDAADDDDDAPINEETFGNKPINMHEGQKLQGIAQDWTQMATLLKNSAFTLLNEVAGAVAEVNEGKDSEEVGKLDVLMRELVDIHVELGLHAETLSELHQAIRGQEEDNLLERYEAGSEEKANTYMTKTSRQKYAKNEAYISFRQTIWESLNPEKGMPPIVELIPKEDGDVSDDDDDDIQVGGLVQDLKCPLTLTLMVNPVTSMVCNHSFSKEAIDLHLGSNKYTKKRCPATGCNKMICGNDFKPNKNLERRIKAQQRRQAQDDDSSGEEVIE